MKVYINLISLLFSIKLKTRIFFPEKKLNNLIVFFITALFSCCGFVNGNILNLIIDKNTNSSIILYSNIGLLSIFILSNKLFNFSNIPGFIRSLYPLSPSKRFFLFYFYDIVTYKNFLFFVYLFFTFLACHYLTFAVFLYQLFIFILLININIAIRGLLSIHNFSLSSLIFIVFNIVSIIFIIKNNFHQLSALFFEVLGFIIILYYYSTSFSPRFFTIKKKINQKSFHNTGLLRLLVRLYFSSPNIVKLYILVLVIKSVFIIGISLGILKFIIGFKIFFILFSTPLIFFTYIHNNVIGLTKSTFLNIIQSSNYIASLLKIYIIFTAISIISDLIITSSLLFLINYHIIPFVKPVISIDYRFILFYFESCVFLSILSLFFCQLRPRKIGNNIFSKNTTSPLFSFISIISVLVSGIGILFSKPFIFNILAMIIFISGILLLYQVKRISLNNRYLIYHKII